MIIMVGPFPLPIHGQSLINQRVADRLSAENLPMVICNTSPRLGTVAWQYHWSRFLAYLRCGRVILQGKQGKSTAVYLSLSGGFGLIYEVFIVALARALRHQIIFHHHSFAYLNKRSILMRAIIIAAGRAQLHIALCSLMAARLIELYDSRLSTLVVSNWAFFDGPALEDSRSERALSAIGYLSNISFEKGIDRFLDIMAELRARGSRVRARIAGPFGDSAIESYVRTRIDQIGAIDYVGPVYGAKKSEFLSSIDLLVFPTRYVHEAEPLVIYEAQAAGVVVAASDRGCICEMIPPELKLDPTASDIRGIVEQILAWETAPSAFLAALRGAWDRRSALAELQSTEYQKFRNAFIRYR